MIQWGRPWAGEAVSHSASSLCIERCTLTERGTREIRRHQTILGKTTAFKDNRQSQTYENIYEFI